MDIAAIVERAEHITAVRRDASADGDQIQAGLVSVRQIQAWCDAQHAGLVAQLRAIDSFPEKRIADASKQSLGHATKSTERSATLEATPQLTEALTNGAITADHVDAVTRASKRLDGAQRHELVTRADQLADVAKAASVEAFARRLDLEAKRLQEGDGTDRLERQQRNARARSWVDPDGMWNLSAKFDPLTGVRIASRVDATVESLFGETVPDECPTDPIEKQRYLAAQAVAQLLLDDSDHARPGSAGPAAPRADKSEYVAVIDADAPDHDGPVAEFAIPVEIPARILAELAGDADVHAVIVRNGVVLHAPGELDLGRTTRLANRAQRRALRGLVQGLRYPGLHRRPTTAASCTTSSGGATAAAPTWPICCRCAHTTTPRSTTTTGSSNSDPTENSPSPSPTAASTPPAHPVDDNPPPDPIGSGPDGPGRLSVGSSLGPIEYAADPDRRRKIACNTSTVTPPPSGERLCRTPNHSFPPLTPS